MEDPACCGSQTWVRSVRPNIHLDPTSSLLRSRQFLMFAQVDHSASSRNFVLVIRHFSGDVMAFLGGLINGEHGCCGKFQVGPRTADSPIYSHRDEFHLHIFFLISSSSCLYAIYCRMIRRHYRKIELTPCSEV